MTNRHEQRSEPLQLSIPHARNFMYKTDQSHILSHGYIVLLRYKFNIMKIIILDPALCCSTGVCGTDVDDALVQTSAHVKWLKSLGHDVHRHTIANDAASFKQYPLAIDKLQRDGVNSLPYILVNDQLVLTGRYPDKAEWETLVSKISDVKNDLAGKATLVNSSCCSEEKCC